jgi:hypothetical protein
LGNSFGTQKNIQNEIMEIIMSYELDSKTRIWILDLSKKEYNPFNAVFEPHRYIEHIVNIQFETWIVF